MAGRRPKPTTLKLATGNPGKRRLNAREAVTDGVPVAPEHLSERAAKAWVHVLPILTRRGLAGDLDGWALERLCCTYAELLAAEEAVEQHGLTYDSETENGTITRPRPEVAIRADADRRFKAYLVEFGMTPAARSKVQVADPPKAKDPEEAYFGQAG